MSYRRRFHKHKKRLFVPPQTTMYTPSFLLNPVWNTWISDMKLPCRFQLNKEHVIPRSIIHSRSITESPHNIIGFPVRLNHRRSNFRYTDSKKPGIPVWPCKTCREPHCPLLGKLNREGFTPPAIYKPIIAASILRSLFEHPEITDIVHTEVLDLGIALEWANEGYHQLPNRIKEIFDIC